MRGSGLNFREKEGKEAEEMAAAIPEKITQAISELTESAVKQGAAKEFITYLPADQIVVAGPWVLWKCQFGCSNYGNSLACPPYIPPPEATVRLINQYNHAVLIGFHGTTENMLQHHKQMNKALYKLEKEAFFKGFVKAVSFAAGTCLFCKKCIVQEEFMKEIPADIARRFCRHKNKSRPSLEAAGIDVFATVRNAGLEIEVINEQNVEKMRHFGILLLE
jgi:predicted metal-binding protein